MDINNKTLQALQAGIKFREMRQEVISSNVANADTPGYKAKRLDFESALARALDVDNQLSMKTTSDKHFNVGGGGLNNIEPEVFEDPNGIVSEDGNTVDRQQEKFRETENPLTLLLLWHNHFPNIQA